jgi:hypothetical protein
VRERGIVREGERERGRGRGREGEGETWPVTHGPPFMAHQRERRESVCARERDHGNTHAKGGEANQ